MIQLDVPDALHKRGINPAHLQCIADADRQSSLRLARLRPLRQPEPLADPFARYQRQSASERLAAVAAKWHAENGRQPRRPILRDAEAEAKLAFIDAAFATLPPAVRAEGELLGTLMLRPALHGVLRLKSDDFTDPYHRQIFFFAWALWRLKQPASANGVALCLWWLTPLLQGGDKPSPIEELVFETLGWRFNEYIFELEARADA